MASGITTVARPGGALMGVRLFFTILFCALGLWFAATGRAKFNLGGDDDGRRAIHVDARGLDAAAIGAFFIGLGVVNLALGIRGDRRIAVFWIGVAIIGAAAVYGIAHVFI